MTKRRTFLRSTAAAATALPSFNILADGKKSLTVGSGEHTYECIHNWGKLPDGHSYGNASHGAAIDSTGLIYVSHQGSPGSVFVFDAKGKFVKSMIPEHGKPGNRAGGHGIDIRREHDGREYLYLSPSDSSMAFTKATLDGEIVWSRGKPDLEKHAGLKLGRYRPTNVNFAPDGSVYLGDGYGSGYIFRYTSNGEFMGVFGGSGTEDGKFKTPHGQWLDMRDGTPKSSFATAPTSGCNGSTWKASTSAPWTDFSSRRTSTFRATSWWCRICTPESRFWARKTRFWPS